MKSQVPSQATTTQTPSCDKDKNLQEALEAILTTAGLTFSGRSHPDFENGAPPPNGMTGTAIPAASGAIYLPSGTVVQCKVKQYTPLNNAFTIKSSKVRDLVDLSIREAHRRHHYRILLAASDADLNDPSEWGLADPFDLLTYYEKDGKYGKFRLVPISSLTPLPDFLSSLDDSPSCGEKWSALQDSNLRPHA